MRPEHQLTQVITHTRMVEAGHCAFDPVYKASVVLRHISSVVARRILANSNIGSTVTAPVANTQASF